jgi:hypothetical protein
MLVRLLYASRATQAIDHDGMVALLKKSRTHNPAVGITGALCLCPSSGVFLQVLEGGRGAVSALYARIGADPRHHDVTLLHFAEIGERRFGMWSMGQVNLARLNPVLLLKYSETATLDPFALSGVTSMALFDELVATASIVGQG